MKSGEAAQNTLCAAQPDSLIDLHLMHLIHRTP